jgi:hypothetical protein
MQEVIGSVHISKFCKAGGMAKDGDESTEDGPVSGVEGVEEVVPEGTPIYDVSSV